MARRGVRVLCSQCAVSATDLPDDAALSPKFRFTCKACTGLGVRPNSETFPYQHDPDLPRKHTGPALANAGAVDEEAERWKDDEVEGESADAWMPSPAEAGITTNTQTGRPWIPEGMTEKKIRRIRKPVPERIAKFATAQTIQEGDERAKVANLYWNLQWSVEEIHDELGLTIDAIKGIIKRLRKGTVRSVGRPAKSAEEKRTANAARQRRFRAGRAA